MNIKIITDNSFPNGLAGTNRIMAYAKGLVRNNCKVSVFCLKPTENPKLVFNKMSVGFVDGIFFNYLSGKTIRSNFFLIRQVDHFFGLMKICFLLLSEGRHNKTDAIIFYSTSTSSAVLLFLVTRVKRIILVKEESEFPFVYLIKNHYIRNFLYRYLHYLLFDGLLLMTKRLINYFKDEKKISTLSIHIPMTVDFDRFNTVKKNHSSNKYIAFCGILNNEKDGVDLLIEAFSIVVKDFPEFYLYLIGDSISQEVYQSYQKNIESKKLNKKVVFTGRVDKDMIPELLCNASILVLARPKSIQAEGGFPSKLGEYLATGNPVVVTRVGEIPDYLTDGENVFMAEPGDVESLTNKIKEVLSNYKLAIEIAEKGKSVAIDNFNYEKQAEKILSFIKSL